MKFYIFDNVLRYIDLMTRILNAT